MKNSNPDPFTEIISANTKKFSETAVEMLEVMFSANLKAATPDVSTNGFGIEKDFFVSIFFTGMVYGEYILATNQETVASILGIDLKNKQGLELVNARKDMTDGFCELLNMIVGQSIVELNKTYQKLTVTPPRISFGSLVYPKVTMGKSILTFDKGTVECYLYIDRMKLDIASSYKDALVTVLKAHKDLQDAMKKLQLQQTLLVHSEKMAALGTMAAGVAHEINTPLATVTMVGSQLKDILQSEETVDKISFIEMLDVIDKTVRQIAKITNSMRTFAQGVSIEKMTNTNVNQIVEKALENCQQRITEGEIKISKKLAISQCSIECRGPEITEVLQNLINNSCDAISNLPEKWIHIEISEDPSSVEIKISDSGKGISLKDKEKIFDPFFTTKDIGNAGLGLSISQGIVKHHSGQIGLDEKCANTCFYVRLPKHVIQKESA